MEQELLDVTIGAQRSLDGLVPNQAETYRDSDRAYAALGIPRSSKPSKQWLVYSGDLRPQLKILNVLHARNLNRTSDR